jgi:HSP20 family protein
MIIKLWEERKNMVMNVLDGADLLSAHMRQMMDRLSRLGQGEQSGWTPSVDIYETAEAVVLVAEVAGLPLHDVRILVDEQVVRIYGHRHPTCCNPGAHYHRMEISSGGFVRSFRIEVPFVASRVSARFEDGMLYVTLPKRNPDQD